MIKDFKIVRHLRHDSIVKAYELFIDYNTENIYYIMELVEGKKLSSYIRH